MVGEDGVTTVPLWLLLLVGFWLLACLIVCAAFAWTLRHGAEDRQPPGRRRRDRPR
jgi:fatty acid desaturase